MPQGDVKEATTVGYAAHSLDREDDSSAARCQDASMEKHLEGAGQACEAWIKTQPVGQNSLNFMLRSNASSTSEVPPIVAGIVSNCSGAILWRLYGQHEMLPLPRVPPMQRQC